MILSDVAPPSNRALAKIPDPRARQFWDPERALSRAILESATDPSHPLHGHVDDDTIVWDFVALYPPDARWEEAPPIPEYHGAPIVEVEEELRAWLARSTTSHFFSHDPETR